MLQVRSYEAIYWRMSEFSSGSQDEISIPKLLMTVEILAQAQTKIKLRGACLYSVLSYGHQVETSVENSAEVFHTNALNYYGKTLSTIFLTFTIQLF